MGTIGCKEFMNHVEPWMDGERHPDARAHARDCARCRGLVEDFDAIQIAARDLSTVEEEPAPHVWTLLRAQLEQEGLIRNRNTGWFRGFFGAIPRPALAGAYLAILIAAAVALSGPIHRQVNDYRWIQGTETAKLGADLDSVEQNTVAAFSNYNPVVTASLHQNLAIVDNYIALCEKSVREEPENEMARDYLYGAYEQKADLLAQMAERGEYTR
jgi:hypothetical protein